jgi:hypothetical protein
MSPISFVLPVLVALVLVGVVLVLRAFFRVQGEPILAGAAPDDLRDVDSPIQQVFIPPPAQASSIPRPAAQAGSREPVRRPGSVAASLDPETRSTLKRWYSGRDCAVCRREVTLPQRADQRPGLLTAESPGEIVTWDEIPKDQLEAVLESHQPVCASCVLAESFRRRFPDRVTDRPDTAGRDRAYH